MRLYPRKVQHRGGSHLIPIPPALLDVLHAEGKTYLTWHLDNDGTIRLTNPAPPP
jgi:antitoxin component of MazEF toxin-antitoxin module